MLTTYRLTTAKCTSYSSIKQAEFLGSGPSWPQWEIIKVPYPRACISSRIVSSSAGYQLQIMCTNVSKHTASQIDSPSSSSIHFFRSIRNPLPKTTVSWRPQSNINSYRLVRTSPMNLWSWPRTIPSCVHRWIRIAGMPWGTCLICMSGSPRHTKVRVWSIFTSDPTCISINASGPWSTTSSWMRPLLTIEGDWLILWRQWVAWTTSSLRNTTNRSISVFMLRTILQEWG